MYCGYLSSPIDFCFSLVLIECISDQRNTPQITEEQSYI